MSKSHDSNFMPGIARDVLENPVKPKGTGIIKLPLDIPSPFLLSFLKLNHNKSPAPQMPFMVRKKTVVRRTLDEFVGSVSSHGRGAVHSIDPAKLCFSTPMQGMATADSFSNITNPTAYVGPDYGHRDILAAYPHPLTHCRNKEAKEKCSACLLHDFKICETRLKETNIKLADAKLLTDS
ncbi:uncharacterized protein RAG0_06283 [Rhynchosporium agropyri]|uniref:Uncharacterized protein n=1 Tax=Rhynchosporium agropyri TaxID=914238 RepID=A0A1E1KK02_9HELO|nr:uncharacterized protein RAG0_06283 [Rhynchosporium agropyri]